MSWRAGRVSGRSDLRMADVAGGHLGAAMSSRDTSFYYSFLVLPERSADAIIAVWDFCRAVDDAVDEVAPESQRGRCAQRRARSPRSRWRAGGPSWTRCSRELPTTPQGQALQPFVRRFNLPQLQFEALIDGVEMDLSHHRYPNFETLLQILPPGRVVGGSHLRGDLRLPRSARARLRRQPGGGAAADQHHARRGGGPEEGPGLPAARRHAVVPRDARTICARRGHATASGSCCAISAGAPGLLPARHRSICRGSTPEPGGGRDHGRHLLRHPPPHRAGQATTCSRRSSACRDGAAR